MKKTAIEDILRAAGGKLICSCDEKYITGVKHDSREAAAGDMFVAIAGENHDGHSFIPKAVQQGCRTFLVSDEGTADGSWRNELAKQNMSVNAILVDNTIEAMGKLAGWYLDSLNIKKVAVTGSVGKTSTRDMVYYVLSEKYNCGRNLRNYNNNIGLPISIFRFDEKTEAAVLEMGMDDFGEIDYLSSIVRPDIGIITNIGVAHMEKLGSREGIFRAKMEITANIAPKAFGGTLIYPADGQFLTRERTAGDYRQIEISEDYIIINVADNGIDGIEFTISDGKENARVSLPVAGTHNAVNASLALAAGRCMGVDLETGAAGLAKAELTGSRLKAVSGKNVLIIDDTYNANPDSMKSAIDVLMNSRGKRRIAILGDMFELGKNTRAQHRDVGEYAAAAGVDAVFAIGELSSEIAEGSGGMHFADKDSFFSEMPGLIEPGDTVLVKASRGMRLEEAVELLKEL